MTKTRSSLPVSIADTLLEDLVGDESRYCGRMKDLFESRPLFL